MNHPRQARWWSGPVRGGADARFASTRPRFRNFASAGKIVFRAGELLDATGAGESPVYFFRQLLAMTPQEREDYLTNRPPEIHERILAKVHEYLALEPDERELRLRATELRWTECRCCVNRRQTGPRGWRRCRRICAGWFKAGSRVGAFCRRRCSRSFWTTKAPCITSRMWIPPTARCPEADAANQARWNALSENDRLTDHRRVQPVF